MEASAQAFPNLRHHMTESSKVLTLLELANAQPSNALLCPTSFPIRFAPDVILREGDNLVNLLR
jgi:hypothetical protein